jgi:Ca-activated chloride channel family protein
MFGVATNYSGTSINCRWWDQLESYCRAGYQFLELTNGYMTFFHSTVRCRPSLPLLLLLLCFSLSAVAQNDAGSRERRQTLDGERVVVNSDLISFNVTVTDHYGRAITGLQKRDFKILDDKQEVEITSFSEDDTPVSLGIVFDLTGSMSGEKIARATNALSHFLELSHKDDEYSLIGIQGGRIDLLLDRKRDGDSLLNTISTARTNGTTAFFDACYLGVERVMRGAHPKRALLVISDGQDNNSRYKFKELHQLIEESDVIVYAIGIVGGGTGVDRAGQENLVEIAAASGGKAFFPYNSNDMESAFDKIAIELRRQYTVGYRPANFAPDRRWHTVKVKVAKPPGIRKITVRARRGYYAQPGAPLPQ